jgi:hypothetical protein
LIITDQKDPVQFLETLVTSLTDSIKDHERVLKKSKTSGMKTISEGREDGDFIEVSATYYAVKFPKLPPAPDSDYWLKFPQLLRRISGKTTLRISKAHFGSGENSFAYKTYDVGRD